MELTGTIEKIFDTQTYGSNGFKKREFVIGTQEQYPQQIKFEMVQDKCTILDTYRTGDKVTVAFDIRGREYNEKYFVNLQAWKIQKEGNTAFPIADAPPIESITANDEAEQADDDLPF